MKREAKKRTRRLRDFLAIVGEHSEEYLVIIKDADSALYWSSSDPTWAEGAARRYCRMADEKDRESTRFADEE